MKKKDSLIFLLGEEKLLPALENHSPYRQKEKVSRPSLGKEKKGRFTYEGKKFPRPRKTQLRVVGRDNQQREEIYISHQKRSKGGGLRFFRSSGKKRNRSSRTGLCPPNFTESRMGDVPRNLMGRKKSL